MTGLATNFVEYFKREAALETLVRITFGTFMGGLVLLLTLLYSGCRSSDRTVTIWRLPAPPGPNVGFYLRVHDLVPRDNIVCERRLARNKPPPRSSAQAPDPRYKRCGNRKTADVIAASASERKCADMVLTVAAPGQVVLA